MLSTSARWRGPRNVPTPCAHRREVGDQRRGHVLRPRWTRSLRSLGPARARQHKPRQAAVLEASDRPLSRLVRPPSAGARTVFMRSFGEAPHTSRDPPLRGSPASSHKNEFCLLRPPGARPALSALRLSTPCAFAPSRGRRVGQAATGCGGSRPRTVAAFRGRRIRGDHLPAQELRGGFAPTAQPRRAAALLPDYLPLNSAIIHATIVFNHPNIGL